MEYFLALLASVLAGFINTLSGSGSLIMVPMLMWLGLPAPIANGTNRVAIVFQSAIGVRTYFKNMPLQIGTAWWVIIPSVAGACIGAFLATITSAALLEQLIGILMVVMLFIILLKPTKWLKEETAAVTKEHSIVSQVMMFTIGLYGGFIQGGVGVFLLIAMVMFTGYSVRFSNGIKLLIVAIYALPVLAIFIIQNQIDWKIGLFTAVGQGFGAHLGALFATRHPNANLWTYRLLIVVLLAAIIEFYKPYSYFL